MVSDVTKAATRPLPLPFHVIVHFLFIIVTVLLLHEKRNTMAEKMQHSSSLRTARGLKEIETALILPHGLIMR